MSACEVRILNYNASFIVCQDRCLCGVQSESGYAAGLPLCRRLSTHTGLPVSRYGTTRAHAILAGTSRGQGLNTALQKLRSCVDLTTVAESCGLCSALCPSWQRACSLHQRLLSGASTSRQAPQGSSRWRPSSSPPRSCYGSIARRTTLCRSTTTLHGAPCGT